MERVFQEAAQRRAIVQTLPTLMELARYFSYDAVSAESQRGINLLATRRFGRRIRKSEWSIVTVSTLHGQRTVDPFCGGGALGSVSPLAG